MAEYKLGFIGVGNMGGALARAAAKAPEAPSMILAGRTPEKPSGLAAELGCAFGADADAAAKSEYVFLGVKPQVIGGVLREAAPVLKGRRDRFVLVSMAAAVTIAKVRELAGGDYPVVRIMPNTPVAVGKGTIMYCSEGVSGGEISELAALLKAGGSFEPMEERLIDAGGAVAGCGPAYVYMFIEALADGAVECGVPRAQAVRLAAQMAAGSAEMVLRSGKHPGELKDAVCSPGGSTIAGVHALESRGFRAAAMDAVKAACDRTKEMAKS